MTNVQRDLVTSWRSDDINRRKHTNLLVLELLESQFPASNLMFKEQYKHDESLSLEQFLNKLFDLTERYWTISSDSHNELCTNGKHRSFIDIFRICRYYYKCNLYTFLKTLQNVQDISAYWCPDIKRCIIAPDKLIFKSWVTDLNIPAEEFGFRTYQQLVDLLKEIKEEEHE